MAFAQLLGEFAEGLVDHLAAFHRRTRVDLVLFALPILLVVAIPFILLIWIIKRLRRRERAAEASASSQE